MRRLLGELTDRLGAATIAQARKMASSAAMVCSVVVAGLQPRNWSRTVRQSWNLQVRTFGINALGITCFLAFVVGVLLCVQYQMIIGEFNQSGILPSIFVVAVVRELGPLLVNFILIARSGNAICTELALMQVSGEVEVIEGLGIDEFVYLVMPRVLGLVFCAACLTVLFITASLLAVYLCGTWIGTKTGSPAEFADEMLTLLTPADVINLLLKSTIPPMIAGCICCLEGLTAGNTFADVPRAAMRAVQRSIIILFAASALISIFTYLR